MLALLQDLVRHKAFADASLLRAIRQHEAAARDEELRKLLHHILLANRYWLTLSLGIPFRGKEEARVPDSLDEILKACRETHAMEREWIDNAQESELERMLESPWLPGRKIPVAHALIQVCMHSQGHRAQCAARLRSLGGEPPTLDFVLWVEGRRGADWS